MKKCGPDAFLGHQKAAVPHNPEVAGSSPVPATTKTRSEKTGSFSHENPHKIYRQGERTRNTKRPKKRTPRKRFAAVNGGAWLDFGSRKTRGRWSKALKTLYSITAFL